MSCVTLTRAPRGTQKPPQIVCVPKVGGGPQKDIPMDAIRELKTMRDLDHPQVLRLRDVFCTSEGKLTLVLDLMPYDLERFLA